MQPTLRVMASQRRDYLNEFLKNQWILVSEEEEGQEISMKGEMHECCGSTISFIN